MTTKYFAILTSQGAAKLANAAALGINLNVTQMAVGDANGILPTPDPAQTKLINQKRIAPLNQLSIDPNNTSQIIAEQIIPESEGGFWVREIGLFDDAGVLIAVANCPETYKPQLQEGSGRTQTIRMILIVSNVAAVSLKIDPAVVLATRKYVDEKVIEVKTYTDDQIAKTRITVPVDEEDTMHLSGHMFMFADQTLPVFVRSIFGDRKDYSSKFLNFGVRDSAGDVYSVESDYSIELDAAKIPFPVDGDHYYFTARREYYQADSRQKKQVLFRKVAPTAVSPNNLKYLIIGDSNTNIAFTDLLQKILRSRGHNPTFVGTIRGQGLDGAATSGPYGEGRSAWSTANFTNRVTTKTPVAVGSESTYMSMNKEQKFNKNPFIIASGEKDSYNGYKFDFSSYLSRFNVEKPDVVGIGLGPNNLYLTGTEEEIATDYINDLRIMLDSIWATDTSIKVALYLRGMSKTEAQDGLIGGHRALQKKLIEFTRSHSRNGKTLWLLHSWAHMTQEAGYSLSGTANSVGVTNANISDGVHSSINEATRAMYAATVAPWMAWVHYSGETAGYNGEPPHTRSGKGAPGVLLGVSDSIDAVPAVQQSGVTAGESIHALTRAHTSAFGPQYVTCHARGSEYAPQPVESGDSLGKYASAGYTGTKFMLGSEIEFYVDGTPADGQYVPSGMRLTVVQDANQGKITALRIRASRNIEAGYDNVQSLGTPNYRWSAIYSGTPSISTSDESHKPIKERIPDSVLDAWQQVDWRTRYKFDNAIAEKGEDGARWHFGLIAQRVEKVFSEHGIDGFSFGLLCYDEWESAPAVLDEDGKTISQEVKAGSRYGIRYGEAQALEAALQRRNYERQQDINRKQAATLMELQSRIEVLERRESA